MTDARNAYDESNEVWPFFSITSSGVVLIPMTSGQLVTSFSAAKSDAAVSAEHQRFRANRVRKNFSSSWKMWFTVAGWSLVAFLSKLVRDSDAGATAETAAAELWDPYEISKVAKSASMKEIKSAYRKSSSKFHPDKVKDVAEASKEEIENIYVEITKAYRASTDEVTRDNFSQYGHPDGPQPVTHGIASPAFSFNPAASVSFVGIYSFGFGVGVPLVVAFSWTQSKVRTRYGLLQATAAQFAESLAKEQPHFSTRKRILDEVLGSADMTEALEPHHFTSEERHALLHNYMTRKTPQSHDELVVAAETAKLLTGSHEFAAGFRSFVSCQRILDTHRAVIQAVPFERISEAELSQLKGAPGFDEPDQQKSGMAMLKSVDEGRAYLPKVHLSEAEFRVLGAKQVYTNSRPHLEIKYVVVPLGDTPPQPSRDESERSESDDAGSPDKHNASRPPLGPAVAPYFPLDEQIAWQVYLYNDRDNKLMEKPVKVTNMDLHNLKLTRAQVADNEDVHYDTIVIPSSTPTSAQPGIAPSRLAVLSTAYFGCDMLASVVMKVVAAPEPEPSQDDNDDASEQSEDSDEEVEGSSDIDTSTEEEDEGEDEQKSEPKDGQKSEQKSVHKDKEEKKSSDPATKKPDTKAAKAAKADVTK